MGAAESSAVSTASWKGRARASRTGPAEAEEGDGGDGRAPAQAHAVRARVRLAVHEVAAGDLLNGTVQVRDDGDDDGDDHDHDVQSIAARLVKITTTKWSLRETSSLRSLRSPHTVTETVGEECEVDRAGGAFYVRVPADAAPSIRPDPRRKTTSEIRYLVRATLRCADGSSTVRDQDVVLSSVRPAIVSAVDKTFTRSFGGCGSCLIGDGGGDLKVQVQVSTNAFEVGDTAEVSVDITNESFYAVRAISCALCETQDISLGGKGWKRFEASGVPVKRDLGGGRGVSLEAALELPISFERPTAHGPACHVFHSIRVIIRTNYAQDPMVSLDVPVTLYGRPDDRRLLPQSSTKSLAPTFGRWRG